jgi:hypothetical protein
MVFVGANSFRWQGNQVVSYFSPGEWYKRPLVGVRVHFGCSEGGNYVVRFTGGNGIAGITAREAKEDLGCEITSMRAHLAGLNDSSGLPNRSQPTYDFYYEGHSFPATNPTFSVPAQQRGEEPIVKKIGIRPTVQGQVSQKSSGKAVVNRQVCVTYRSSQESNGRYCEQPSAGIARRDATDGNGRYMIYTSWGDIARNRANGFQGDTVWLASGAGWKATMFNPNSTPLQPMQGPSNTRNGQTTCMVAEQFYSVAKSKVGQVFDKVPGTSDRGPCDTFVRREVMLPVLGSDMRTRYGINHPAGGARNLMQELERLVAKGGAEKIPLNRVEAGDIFYNYPSNKSTTGHVGIIQSPGVVIDAESYPGAGSSRFIVNKPNRYNFALAYRICE